MRTRGAQCSTSGPAFESCRFDINRASWCWEQWPRSHEQDKKRQAFVFSSCVSRRASRGMRRFSSQSFDRSQRVAWPISRFPLRGGAMSASAAALRCRPIGSVGAREDCPSSPARLPHAALPQKGEMLCWSNIVPERGLPISRSTGRHRFKAGRSRPSFVESMPKFAEIGPNAVEAGRGPVSCAPVALYVPEHAPAQRSIA